MKYRFKLDIGDRCSLITDNEKNTRIVTGISIRQNGCISYELSCSNTNSWHYEFEIIPEQKKITIGYK